MWYFLVQGEGVYRPAPEQIAAVLDIARAAFAELDRQENVGQLATAEAARWS
jgi:hypothetical protein